LHDAQPVGVGEGLEAFGRLPQALEARELGRSEGLSLGVDHDGMAQGLGRRCRHTAIISEHSDSSMTFFPADQPCMMDVPAGSGPT
jgi:hypothetical protein